MCQFSLPNGRCAIDDNFCARPSHMDYLLCATRSLGMFLDESGQVAQLGDCLTCSAVLRDTCSYAHGIYDIAPNCNIIPP